MFKLKRKSTIAVIMIISIMVSISILNRSIKANNKVLIEYYYFTPCASCTDGEEFKQRLEEKISTFINANEYVFEIYNTMNEDSNDRFLEITKDLQMPEGSIVDLPMLRINQNFIFGVEAIEKEAIDIIKKVKK